MKKKLILILTFFSVFVGNLFADTFTDAIQDLAVSIACKGTYSATEAGGGWQDDPHDYYTPQMMAQRFARESGNKTMTTTFYGVCFNYAQFAWSDITRYKSWYNQQGMYEAQFWLAGVKGNSNQIELMSIGTKNDYSRLQNGEYIKTYSSSLRNVKTHRLNNQGERATYHAWIWIERADGVWFWIDPTWTDNLGYVVYGYVKNGEEIQCRPDAKYCINNPSSLQSLPLPPAMGNKKAPSKTANSTNREETINDAGTDWLTKALTETFIDVDYSGMDYGAAFIFSANIPFSAISDKEVTVNKMGFSLELATFLFDYALFFGIEYMQNLQNGNQLHGGVITFDWTRRLANNVAWFIGGGPGLRFDFSNKEHAYYPTYLPMTNLFAYKVNTGFLFSLWKVFTKVEVSFDAVLGFSAGVGFGINFY